MALRRARLPGHGLVDHHHPGAFVVRVGEGAALGRGAQAAAQAGSTQVASMVTGSSSGQLPGMRMPSMLMSGEGGRV
jgi:hypothetical protein